MYNARDIVNALGRDSIIKRMGVSTQSVSDAVVTGTFPPAWYVPLVQLAHERGVGDLPLAAFRWRALKSTGSKEGAARPTPPPSVRVPPALSEQSPARQGMEGK